MDNSPQNPMMIDVILKHFFKVIPYNPIQFKTFRLVCRKWRDLSLPRLREDALLKLDERIERDSSGSLVKGERLQLDSIFQWLYTLLGDNLYFRRFLMEHFSDFSWNIIRTKFWLDFGPEITHLEISHSKIKYDHLHRILFEKTPNLKVLSLKRNRFLNFPVPNVNDCNEWEWKKEFKPLASRINNNMKELMIDIIECDTHDFPVSWMEIICHFPKIKILKLQFHKYHFYSHFHPFKSFLRALIAARRHCGLDYLVDLEHLDINHVVKHYDSFWGTAITAELPSDMVALLGQLVFPLKTLAFDVRKTETDRLNFTTLLERYSQTLQHLTVFCYLPFSSCPFQETFPFGVELSQLTELVLIGLIFKNLDFLGHVPQLKKLVIMQDAGVGIGIRHMRKEWTEEDSIYKYPSISKEDMLSLPPPAMISESNFSGPGLSGLLMTHLKTFVVGREYCSKEQVMALSKLMPNLTTLQLGMGNGGFQILSTEWKNLEHLHIDPMDVDDEGLLGMENGEKFRAPNLTDLKRLKTFSVGPTSSNRGGSRAELTRGAIMYGVLRLQDLEDALFGIVPEAHEELQTVLAAKFPGMRF
ncbi:unnamed protein product [Orchesella dallaii]